MNAIKISPKVIIALAAFALVISLIIFCKEKMKTAIDIPVDLDVEFVSYELVDTDVTVFKFQIIDVDIWPKFLRRINYSVIKSEIKENLEFVRYSSGISKEAMMGIAVKEVGQANQLSIIAEIEINGETRLIEAKMKRIGENWLHLKDQSYKRDNKERIP